MTLIGTWEDFTYGKTCRIRIGAEQPLPVRGKVLSWKSIVFKLGASIGMTALVCAPLRPTCSTAETLCPQIFEAAHYGSGLHWGRAVRKTREFLSFSQADAAKFLNLSLASLQKLEQGDTDEPYENTLLKYKSLIELGDLLKGALRGKKYTASAALRTPITAFGDMSALDFAEKLGEGGFLQVLGTFKRIYG